MLSLSITDVKSFMGQLFAKNFFDAMGFVEASIKMNISYHIDGHINNDFFDTEEKADLTELCLWKDVKEQIFHMIKGKKLPLSMKIILKIPEDTVREFIQSLPGSIRESDIEGCYLNILYDQPKLTCTTGVSYRSFILDKSLEHTLDEYIRNKMKSFL